MRLWQNYRILTAARPGKQLQNYRILDAEKLAKFAEMIANIRENIRKRDYFSQRNRCFFSIRKFCKVYGNFVKYNEVLSSIHKFCHCWIVWLSNCGFFRADKFVTDALCNPPSVKKPRFLLTKPRPSVILALCVSGWIQTPAPPTPEPPPPQMRWVTKLWFPEQPVRLGKP